MLADVLAYLGMIMATLVFFSCLMWAVARLCGRAGRGRRCIAVGTLLGGAVGIPIWALLMQVVVPGQEWLGVWWWLVFIPAPVAAILAASLFLLWVGPKRTWKRREHARAAVGSLLCGMLMLGVAWGNTDLLWGYATALSGCGPVEGTLDWWQHRELYRGLWWLDNRAWFETECGRRLNARSGDRYEMPPSATATATAPPSPAAAPP